MLSPKCNKAAIKGFPFPEDNLNFPPIFEIVEGNLLMKGTKNEFAFIFDIDKQKWITTIRVKAGE
jgi:hypothetical protein